jgi:membrane protease subunit HflK
MPQRTSSRAARALCGARRPGIAAWRTARRRRGADTLVYNNGRNDGPPDLDELWRDFNRKLSGLFGGKGGGQPHAAAGPRVTAAAANFQPDMKSAGIGLGLIAGGALIWLGSGFFIVQEGQQAVVTTFGKYSHTVDAGFQWRFPYPVPGPRDGVGDAAASVEVGRNTVVQATGLRDSSMLTQDENIVDIRFTVQYRLRMRAPTCSRTATPTRRWCRPAESAVREIVGRSKVDSVLYEQRDASRPTW